MRSKGKLPEPEIEVRTRRYKRLRIYVQLIRTSRPSLFSSPPPEPNKDFIVCSFSQASTRLKEHTVHSLERLFPHRYEDKYATEREAKIGETIRKERATKDQRKTDRRDRHKEMRSTIERLENAYLSEVNERRKMEAEIEALKRAAGLTAAAVTDAISAADEPKLK